MGSRNTVLSSTSCYSIDFMQDVTSRFGWVTSMVLGRIRTVKRVSSLSSGQVACGDTPTIYGDGKQTRDYIYVADVVDAFIAATHYAGDEAVFNIGTGNATAVGDLLGVINAAAGTMIEPRFAPARAGEWRHGALDSAHAAAELDWTASTSIVDGIRQTYQQLTGTLL
jgi:UDP-glucose 4-epimerase